MPAKVTEKMKQSQVNSFRNEKGFINTENFENLKKHKKTLNTFFAHKFEYR